MKKGAIKMREINWRYYFKDSEGSVLTIELTMAQIEGAKSGCIQQLRKHFKDCELLDRVEGTGLFDNTGKEIFEKDIVCAYNGKYIGEVVYFPPEFVVQNLKDMRLNFLEPNGKNKINFDVIGNVYQNPQLLEAEVERLRLELLKSQTENERLKRVEESAKKLLDSCLEGESENGDEIDYIEQLRAENKKLKQDIRQFYFDHGVLLKENERLKAVAEAALNLLQKEYVDESHLLDELRQALAELDRGVDE